MVSNLIKYVGGKQKVAKLILSNIPKDITEIRDPFLGGGSIPLSLRQSRKHCKMVLGDFDSRVTNFWNNVLKNPEEFERNVLEFRDKLTKSLNRYNNESSAINMLNSLDDTEPHIYYLLNRIRGQGNYGGFLNIEDIYTELNKIEDRLMYTLYTTYYLMKDISIINEDYTWALRNESDNNVLVFLDPPYYTVCVKGGYYKDHDNFDFDKFKNEIITTKHKFILTMDISEFTEELKCVKGFNYSEFDIVYNYGIKTKEALIKNF